MKIFYAIRPMALIVKLVRFFFMFLTTLSQTNFLFCSEVRKMSLVATSDLVQYVFWKMQVAHL